MYLWYKSVVTSLSCSRNHCHCKTHSSLTSVYPVKQHCKVSVLKCVLCCVFQAVRESQSQAAWRERPQPSPVVQAGTGPPGARGGAGQNDPLSQIRPRYSVRSVQIKSPPSSPPDTSAQLSLCRLWHVIISRDTFRPQNVSMCKRDFWRSPLSRGSASLSSLTVRPFISLCLNLWVSKYHRRHPTER